MYLLDGGCAFGAATRAVRRTHREIRVVTVLNSRASLVVVALSLVLLPFVLDFVGLPLRSAIDVVAFAVCAWASIFSSAIQVSFHSDMVPGRTRRLCCSSEPALLVCGTGHSPLTVRNRFRGGGCCAVWRTDLASPWRLFFIVDAGSDSAALCRRLSLDRVTGGESGLGGVTRATVLVRS